MEKNTACALARQEPLRERYKEAPDEAVITDRARTAGGVETDPFHGNVVLGSEGHGVELPFGIHHAVGGYHDTPNPGDMLCAALAACLDSTVRIIADRLGVTLSRLEVEVTADVDVRGTLLVDTNVPVGFQTMRCHVDIQASEGTDAKRVNKLMAASERSCVNLQTLRSGVSIQTSLSQT
jgi:uncharacterized OsmC-like protein